MRHTNQTLLICACVIILSGLLMIQLYLLRNTYKLSVGAYHSNVTLAYLKLQSLPAYDKMEQQYLQVLTNCSDKFLKGEINEKKFNNQLINSGISTSRKLDSLLISNTHRFPVLKDTKQSLAYTSIVLKGPSGPFKSLSQTSFPILITLPGKKGASTISIGQSTGNIRLVDGSGALNIDYALSKKLELPALPVAVAGELILVAGLSLLLLLGLCCFFTESLCLNAGSIKSPNCGRIWLIISPMN
jgi:hypothetical protein